MKLLLIGGIIVEDKGRNYYAPLDGMRAVSIIAVLLYHSSSRWLEGGFIGVESFFVISGFIITTLLLKEFSNTSTINLPSFYKRRLRRVIPDMIVMIFFTLCVVVIVFPGEIKKSVEDILPSLSFTSNWLYIFNDRSYFEAIGRPRLFEHLWSLSVEFQYYLIWPFICIALLKFRRRNAFLLTLSGALVSTLYMAYLFNPDMDTSRIYFGTDTRASGFFIGSALALAYPKLKTSFLNKTYIATVSSFLSFVGLVICFVSLNKDSIFLYRGGFALAACLSAICIGASLINENTVTAKILGSKIMAGIGLRTYNIYIWHWPIFCLTQSLSGFLLSGWMLFILRILMTLILSEITYRLIVIPVRNGILERLFKNLFSWNMKYSQIAFITVSVIAIVGMTLTMSAKWNNTSIDSYASIAAQQRQLIEMTRMDSVESSEFISFSKLASAFSYAASNIEEPSSIIKKYPMIIYNNEIVDCENYFPENNSGVTCIPVRYLKIPLGFSIDWNGEKYILKISKNNKSILLDYINKKVKLTNGEWTSEEKIYLKNNMAYMPLLTLANELDYCASMFSDSSGYPIVNIVNRDEKVLSLFMEKRNTYINKLKGVLEDSANSYKINFSNENISLEKWEQIGNRLKLNVEDPMKRKLTVTWSSDVNGAHNWENVSYEIDTPCPFWYSWDVGEHQISAKVENGLESRIVSTTIKVFESKEKLDVNKLFKLDFDKSKGYITRIHPTEEKKRPYFAIGDSIMLGAANRIYSLMGEDINIDAKVSRQLYAAKELINEYKNKNLLGDTIILHIGTNGDIGKQELRNVLDIIKDCKKILLINFRVPQSWEESNNTVLQEVSREYPNCEIVDWHGNSIDSGTYFAGDDIHLSDEGVVLYTQLILKAINK